MLKSAHNYGGTSLRRFVLLGSAVSVLNSFEDITREGHPYNENDWNPVCFLLVIEETNTLVNAQQVTAQQAIDQKDTVLGYNVSKTQSEKAAWEFMKTNRPNFDLTVINPGIIIGPMIYPISGPSSINETNHFAIASFIDGTHSAVEDVRFPFHHFVSLLIYFPFQEVGGVSNEE